MNRDTNRVAPTSADSREDSLLLGVFLCDRLTRNRWVASLPPRPGHFCRTLRCLTDRRPPLLSKRVHPPASFASPPECYGPPPALQSRTLGGLATACPRLKKRLLGVCALYATSVQRVHLPPGDPSPELWSVLDVSHVLDGLLRATPCGSISPRSHVQGFPSGVCPSRRSRTRFPAPLPSCRLNEPACQCDPAPANPPSTSGRCSPPEVR